MRGIQFFVLFCFSTFKMDKEENQSPLPIDVYIMFKLPSHHKKLGPRCRCLIYHSKSGIPFTESWTSEKAREGWCASFRLLLKTWSHIPQRQVELRKDPWLERRISMKKLKEKKEMNKRYIIYFMTSRVDELIIRQSKFLQVLSNCKWACLE